MENKNKIILALLMILTISVVGVCIFRVLLKNEKMTDAIKFRNEYIELNDKINENNGKNYVNVKISEDNTVKYVTEEKAVELLESGTGVIYFGFSTCPWCRSLISTLTSVAESKNETIYYLDVLNIRSTYEVKDGKLNKLKEGTKGYYKILNLLDKELEEFYLTDEDGNKYDTLEKRLYAPTLVAVKNGKVTKLHVGTVESQENGYDKLTDNQLEELESIIKDLINSKNDNIACTNEKC